MSRNPVVCFDLGNVLVKLRFDRCLQALCRLGGRDYPSERLKTPVFFDEFGIALSEGKLGADAFLGILADRFNLHKTDRGVIAAAWCSIFDPWPEMEALAEACCDAGGPVWLLSNTDPMHFEYILAKTPVLHRFAGLHLSYEVRCNKPDPFYYERFLQRAGVAAGDCIFVDDRPENIEAAAKLGFAVHLHDGDVAAVRRALVGRGVELASPRPALPADPLPSGRG